MIALLALVCCAVLYAAGRRRGETAPAEGDAAVASSDDARTHFYREQLKGLERDAAAGRLAPSEAAAAKAELAREFVRQNREQSAKTSPERAGRVVLVAIPLVALMSFGAYALMGEASLPARPLDSRAAEAEEAQQSLATAVAQVEARLVETPDDIRGWQVLAPVYMDQQRFPEAVNAYRRVLELAPPTADSETDLAEALILSEGGAVNDEARALLDSAIARDPDHIRSRLYLAGALTRDGEYAAAAPIWSRLIDISLGNEAWLAVAQQGLATAQAALATGAGQTAPSAAPEGAAPENVTDEMIVGMVERLAERLYAEGGTGEEWTRLVQSRIVLGDAEAARADLERGLEALEGAEREALATLGATEGLIAAEDAN